MFKAGGHCFSNSGNPKIWSGYSYTLLLGAVPFLQRATIVGQKRVTCLCGQLKPQHGPQQLLTFCTWVIKPNMGETKPWVCVYLVQRGAFWATKSSHTSKWMASYIKILPLLEMTIIPNYLYFSYENIGPLHYTESQFETSVCPW